MKGLGHKFPNIYARGKELFTPSLTGRRSFDEIAIRKGGILYRQWDPTRSKLAAAIVKGISQIGLKEGMAVLYLGAAHGYTVSYVSDIIRTGIIFAVDPAPQVMRDLIFIGHERKNVAPILGDARDWEGLSERICAVDFLYQDIAQRDQTRIFIKSCKAFLKPGSFGFLVVKARSIDVSKRPKQIFKEVRAELEKAMTIVDYRELEPLEKDHCVFLCKRPESLKK